MMPEPSTDEPRLPPFADWPGGVEFGEDEGTMWFVPPATLCVQTRAARVDLRLARLYMNTLRAIRDAERESIAREGGLRLYQDLRSLQVFERPARIYLAQAALEDIGRWRLACNKIALAAANPIVRITIQLLATVVVKTGVPGFLVVSELGHELERDAVARPETAPEHEARHAVYARLRDAASPDHADRGSFAP